MPGRTAGQRQSRRSRGQTKYVYVSKVAARLSIVGLKTGVFQFASQFQRQSSRRFFPLGIVHIGTVAVSLRAVPNLFREDRSPEATITTNGKVFLAGVPSVRLQSSRFQVIQ